VFRQTRFVWRYDHQQVCLSEVQVARVCIDETTGQASLKLRYPTSSVIVDISSRFIIVMYRHVCLVDYFVPFPLSVTVLLPPSAYYADN